MLTVSRANGPGIRGVVWFQGCSLDCPGCFNPGTHSAKPNILASPVDALKILLSGCETIEGITITGGEPLEQPKQLLELLLLARTQTNLSIILFSGHTMDEITKVSHGIEIINHVDVLISGRFVRTAKLSKGLRGSSNQLIHLITNRIQIQDLEETPDAEIIIDPLGGIAVSGVHDVTPCLTTPPL